MEPDTRDLPLSGATISVLDLRLRQLTGAHEATKALLQQLLLEQQQDHQQQDHYHQRKPSPWAEQEPAGAALQEPTPAVVGAVVPVPSPPLPTYCLPGVVVLMEADGGRDGPEEAEESMQQLLISNSSAPLPAPLVPYPSMRDQLEDVEAEEGGWQVRGLQP